MTVMTVSAEASADEVTTSGSVPVALRGMVRFWAVVLRVRVALRGPGAWGVWVRVRVQVWVGGRGVVQVLSVMR
ncbi:hypothetical protein OG331_48430 [Streptomyces sp. NBC_01017]|nr:hypothetical protein OG331_48430 [Streptomyces sp. NBC_01017]